MNGVLGHMTVDSTLQILFRLLLASFLGAAIGMERESIHSPAGLRTHTLVSVGSALFTLISIDMGRWGGSELREPARIAAQIVSGIGFLGAGTILRSPAGIRGLTTAASLWAVAGIGMAAGAGYYLGALFTTLLVFLCLTFLRKAENKVHILRPDRILLVETSNKETAAKISGIVTSSGFEVRESSAELEINKVGLRLLVSIPTQADYQSLMRNLLDAGVSKYEWDEVG